MKRHRFRAVFISDTHLGSRGCRAEALQSFLKGIDCETLYLVGDIVDFWRLRSRVYWPRAHNEVVRRLLKLVHRGTRVVFIPGNHDETLRDYVDHTFGGIEVRRETVHDCLDGRRLLVAHGDEYDMVVRRARLLSLLGAKAYEWLIIVDRLHHRMRRRLGRPEWSLAQSIKLRVKGACTFLSKYEEALVQVARARGLDGVVCGHVHQPAIGELAEGVAYLNCGDWIENCTALVETTDGAVMLVGADLKPLDRATMQATGTAVVSTKEAAVIRAAANEVAPAVAAHARQAAASRATEDGELGAIGIPASPEVAAAVLTAAAGWGPARADVKPPTKVPSVAAGADADARATDAGAAGLEAVGAGAVHAAGGGDDTGVDGVDGIDDAEDDAPGIPMVDVAVRQAEVRERVDLQAERAHADARPGLGFRPDELLDVPAPAGVDTEADAEARPASG